MELWFTSSPPDNIKECDLRNIPRHELEGLLQIVNCEIISFSKNDEIDAYVLSESSMFIAKRRFILKTCGTTTPLQCLKSLLTLVEQYAGFDQVEDIFYSRKNFKRPDLQKKDYRSFDQEVELLNALFLRGHAYCLGSPKRPDCWYLYTLNPIQDVNNNMDLGCHGNSQDEDDIPDQTLEILMHDLDPKVMQLFTKAQSTSATDATETAGIHKIIPHMKIDDYLFDPCGYSMNGIAKDGSYMTIHITPETNFSYVSFETNVPQQSYHDLITRVLETFQPGKFVLTVFANKTSEASRIPRSLKEVSWFGNKWRQEDIETCRTKNYDFTYTFYSKFPS
ncbi:hypothetical protein M8J76_015143 [Diaphorina citri]|nr:hypothetical protein M8J76_015143 [Diaphorina citri]KAI5753931.1 hypothetical protein M8J77_004378 [Diaphorina citri]